MRFTYILKDNIAVPEPDIIAWEKWIYHENDGKNFIVKKEILLEDIEVSTIFLEISIDGRGLFETMIFGSELNGYCRRYNTYEEALKGHEEAIEKIFEVK